MKPSNSAPPFRLRNALLGSAGLLALALALAPLSIAVDDTGVSVKPASAFASSCFIAGTKVIMADGSERAIEKVGEGDRVLGADGAINAVIGVERVFLAGRRLHGFNGGMPFVTEEHPFMTQAGWKSINPRATRAENEALVLATLHIGDKLAVMRAATPRSVGSSALALEEVLELAWQRLERIEAIDADPATPVFNLLLNGNHSYFADGYLVHNKGGGGGGGGGGGEPKYHLFHVTFDLYTIDSWDGYNGAHGPDYFEVLINGTLKLSDTFATGDLSQTFRPADTGPVHLGYSPAYTDAIYRAITLTFTLPEDTVNMKIDFRGRNLQALHDESWGIDNISVGYTVLPAPGPAALALAGVACLGRRRRA